MATSSTPQLAPTLYHVSRTISSPIYQALLELGVVDDPVRVETLTIADLKTPEHLARNPMGTSPTFVHGPVRIWESGAVLTHLLEEHDPDHTWHPAPGTPHRAVFLHVQQYILATVYPFVATLFLHTLKPPSEQDARYVETATDKWKTLLAPTLESFCQGPFFLGAEMTALDLLVAKPLTNADSMGVLDGFPKLHAIYQKVRCLPSYSKAYGTVPAEVCRECRSMLLLPNGE